MLASPTCRSLLALAGALATLALPAGATIVGGGGSSVTDCLLVFDASVNSPLSRPRNVSCTDGDTTCDCTKAPSSAVRRLTPTGAPSTRRRHRIHACTFGGGFVEGRHANVEA